MRDLKPYREIRLGMYSPPKPLSQDRRAFPLHRPDARTAYIKMTEKHASQPAAPPGSFAPTASRKQAKSDAKQRGSFFRHSALRLVLGVGCLALALSYILAFTPPVRSASVTGPAAGTAPAMGHLVDAAVASVAPPAAKDPLHVVQSSFDPVLVERVDLAAPELTGDMITGASDAPVVTTEMLRILAQMTPEQIDALTFLLLSQQDPKAAAAATDQASALADEAPWVGDWSAVDLDPEQADLDPVEAEVPAQNELLRGWYVTEASADEAVIRNSDDPLSAVRVSPGTVLGNLGFVSEIRIEAGLAKVVLSNGDVILSDATATIEVEIPEPPEPRRGPPFEIALAKAQADMPGPTAPVVVTSSQAEPAAVVAGTAPSAPSVQASPAPSTKSAQQELPKQSAEGAGRYVQVATFKSAANAEIAKKMVVSDGMSGQLRKATLKGASYHRVLAGPFEPTEIQSALGRVTRLGFKDAFIIR